MLFSEAAALWLETRSYVAPGARRARFIRDTTRRSYAAYIDSLNLFFANLRLEQIHLGHLRAYQEARIVGAPPFIRKRRPNKNVVAGPCPAGAKKVNQELSNLKQIMRRAGCWTEEMDEFYEPFSEDVSNVPRAMTPDEQRRWLDVSLLEQRWWIVHWYSQAAFGTSMGTNEMRSLRIGDVNLYHGFVNVPAEGAKNPYRARTIPLISAETKWAFEQLLARARDFGAKDPQHYLFPFRDVPKPFDPAKPMTVTGIKKQWDEVRLASGIKWFRAYDTRHTALTRWAENGMEPVMLMSLAGHITQRMMRHYIHIGENAKRRALAGVMEKVGPKSERPAPFYAPMRLA